MTRLAAPTMAALLRARAAAAPEVVGLRLETDGRWTDWTWAEYWARAQGAAQALQAEGVREGHRVLMLVPEVGDAVATLFGLWILGAVPIQVGVPFRLPDLGAFVTELDAMARALRAEALVVPPDLARLAPPDTTTRIAVTGRAPAANGPELPDPDPARAPALVQLTSGSTGRPRGVVVPHDRLMAHMAAMSDALPSHADSMAVSWLPLHHDMGLIGGLLFPFYNGFPAHMIAPAAFRRRPLVWIEAMARFRGTICAAPPSGYAICLRLAEQARQLGLDLGAWECAMVGAEPIPPALLRRFAAAFAPLGFAPEAFFPVYGLAEATVAVTFPTLGAPTTVDVVDRRALERDGRAVPADPASADTIELTSVGRPIPGTELRLRDAEGTLVGERRVGEILVRAPSLMAGYVDDPSATAAALSDGWLATGDLGYVADGCLFVVGRTKDLIIKGGENVLPAAIEEHVGRDPDVRAGCVVAVGVYEERRATETIYLLCETKLDAAGRAPLAERLRASLRTAGLAIDHVVVVGPGALPRTTSGKLRRAAIREVLARSGGDRGAIVTALAAV